MQSQSDLYTHNELKQIAKYLIKKDVPHDADVIKKYIVSHEHIITGVHCPKCLKIKMRNTLQGSLTMHNMPTHK